MPVPPTPRLPRHRRSPRAERGAVLIEFALVFPIFVVFVLGIITGATTYNRNQAVNSAVREAARFGATLPDADEPLGTNAWLDEVRLAIAHNGTGDVDADAPGPREICVAYVEGDALNPAVLRKQEQTGTATPTETSADATGSGETACYDDGLSVARVQVMASRASSITALAFAVDVTLSSETSTPYER